MTNTATAFPTTIFDERMMLPGHTLVLIGTMSLAVAIIVFGLVRLWQHRTRPEVQLPRRLLLATSILVLAHAVADTLISIADAVAIRVTVADTAASAGLFGIVVAQQLRFVCIPVLVAGIGFALAAAMSQGSKGESPTYWLPVLCIAGIHGIAIFIAKFVLILGQAAESHAILNVGKSLWSVLRIPFS